MSWPRLQSSNRPALTELVFGSVILYANAFSADLGRCSRWVCRESTWQPIRCPGEVATRAGGRTARDSGGLLMPARSMPIR
jgi:hypothetical protein